jgi:hypothetical protein
MRLTVGLALVFSMGVVSITVASNASAQIYKWTDNKGVVHYSDTPVNSQATSVAAAPPPPPSLALPYELAQAARKHPVTLYTAGACAACDQGRALLKARGVPFLEKTVRTDADEARLKEAGSDGGLPLLLVGRVKLVGFEAASWSGALDAAAYPRSSMLPKSYRYQSASAADPVVMPAPVAAPVEPAAPANPAPRRQPPTSKQRSDLPPGFQF